MTVKRKQTMSKHVTEQSDANSPVATSVRPGEFDLGSIQSRVAARFLARKKQSNGFKISMRILGQCRPDDKKPQPLKRWPNGWGTEYFYEDDSDYSTECGR